MREIRKSGSVGASGERSPEATRLVEDAVAQLPLWGRDASVLGGAVLAPVLLVMTRGQEGGSGHRRHP